MNLKDTVAVALDIIRRQGVRAFVKAAIGFLRGTHRDVVIPDPQEPISSLQLDDLPGSEYEETIVSSDTGVSVVIPNLNGAKDLIKLLPALYGQKGFPRIEVILVDSGSTDDSVQLAKSYGANVIQIENKTFSHSHARNIGAENASEQHLLFTVHDALPPSQTWLYQMFSFLTKGHLSAVSCVEKPRIDADLIARVENWYHYREILKIAEGNKILSMPREQNPQTLRANAQLTNVACLIPKDIFLKYKFRGIYAEDLDLGLRLLGDGEKLGLLSSTCVIHSHTRLPYDYVRRGFIDKLTVAQLLDEPLEASHPDFEHFIRDIFLTQDVLSRLDFDAVGGKSATCSVDELANIVAGHMTNWKANRNTTLQPANDHTYLDDGTRKFLERVHQQYYRDGRTARSDGNLLKGILVFMNIAFDYMRTVYQVLDGNLIREVQKLQWQYFVNLTGRYLAVWYLKDAGTGKSMLEPVKNEFIDNTDTWSGTSR